tara:strand:+ start:1642 stop:1833 length:192 start_codon:yes stop_codon:yes gene_type:complete
MTSKERLKLIRKIGNKVNRERKVAKKLARENSIYMDEKEVYNVINNSGIMDTYQAMKEYDAWQ